MSTDTVAMLAELRIDPAVFLLSQRDQLAQLRSLLVPARAAASAAYSAGHYDEAADIYAAIADVYQRAGFVEQAHTFDRRSFEVRARADGTP